MRTVVNSLETRKLYSIFYKNVMCKIFLLHCLTSSKTEIDLIEETPFCILTNGIFCLCFD